ncbi:MAG: NUDIX hydrolase [Actinobacteria bacterium]|nr:NUDIX hydrolase [Actinomycetota bacterium]
MGAVVIDDGRLLMIRRGKEPGRGLWSIPGGRVENGEYLSQALVREVKEETGLDVEVRELLGILEVPGDPHYVILDHVATVVGGEAEPADDVDAVEWVAFEDIEKRGCTPRLLETLKAWGAFD